MIILLFCIFLIFFLVKSYASLVACLAKGRSFISLASPTMSTVCWNPKNTILLLLFSAGLLNSTELLSWGWVSLFSKATLYFNAYREGNIYWPLCHVLMEDRALLFPNRATLKSTLPDTLSTLSPTCSSSWVNEWWLQMTRLIFLLANYKRMGLCFSKENGHMSKSLKKQNVMRSILSPFIACPLITEKGHFFLASYTQSRVFLC